MDHAELLDRGRRAFDERRWVDAWDGLSSAHRGSGLDPEDLERLATAAYLAGRDDDCTGAWIRAHEARLERGQLEAALRCAFWLGFALVQRGEMAQGAGWLARAQTLVDQHRLDCVERGYLLLPEALQALAVGDHAGALDRFGQASDLAVRFADRDLAALGAIGRGEALFCVGRGPEGMRLFDEAMVAVTAGETTPVVSGIVYCAVIDVCQRAFDLARAREWTLALERWCADQPGLVPYRGQCLVHRAQVLQVAGEWGDAVREAERACAVLADPPHPAIGLACYELGELCRLRGEFAQAESRYRQAHASGHLPQPGLALLRLAQGRLDDAVVAIERAVRDARDQVSRARLLAGCVEIMLAARRAADAATAADALVELARTVRTAQLQAVADQARGAVLVARGDAQAAAEPLRRALEAWQALDAPYEAARVRALLAEVCSAVGDHDTAQLERDAARDTFRRLGAVTDLARLGGPGTGAPITAREVEVLRLVAAGRTNREIAQALIISERTVERHLGNIFSKLGVPNRAAATAYAVDHRLV